MNLNIKDIIKYSVKEANKVGISKIMSEAELNGMTVITRYKKPTAMVVPLTMGGYMNYIDVFSKILQEDLFTDTEEYRLLKQLLGIIKRDMQKIEGE